MSKSMSMTEALAAEVDREKLGMMLTIWDELGWREKYVQAPMLAERPKTLRNWLLAGTEEHGFAPGRRARRAHARNQHWRSLAHDGWGNDFPWTVGAAVAATVRLANPLAKPFIGRGSDDQFEEIGAMGLAWCGAALAAIPGAMAGGAAAAVGVGSGAVVGAAVGLYASRAWLALGGEDRRERFKRDSALGGFESMRALAASKAEAFAEAHRIGRSAPKASDMREALRRASLGMEPSEEDKARAEKRGVALEALAAEAAQAEERAKNGLMGECLREEDDLLESIPKAQIGKRPRGGL